MNSYLNYDILCVMVYLYLLFILINCYLYLRDLYIKYKQSNDKWYGIVDIDDNLHKN